MNLYVLAAEAVEPAYSAGPLLLIAAAAVLLLLFLIIKLKLHAFFALILVSLLVHWPPGRRWGTSSPR